MRLDHARKTGIPLAMEYYRDVYHGYLRPGDTLDSLYEKFNRDDRPAANQMHSLSMSDVIVLHKAYYVDDVGFAEIPEFLIPVQEQEQEQEQEQKTIIESTLTFYAAECMEFPVMGEVYRGLTLVETAKALRDIPDDRMHGEKGIGFELQDGSDYAGSYPLVEAGQVMEDTINSVAYYRDHPGLQAAITEAKTYFPDCRLVISPTTVSSRRRLAGFSLLYFSISSFSCAEYLLSGSSMSNNSYRVASST